MPDVAICIPIEASRSWLIDLLAGSVFKSDLPDVAIGPPAATVRPGLVGRIVDRPAGGRRGRAA